MTAWLPTSSRLDLDDLKVAQRPLAGALVRVREKLRTLRDILSICSVAQAAAHDYEQMKPLSNADLAARGTDRADLPRAAFRKLTGEP
jgi:hypothetical protein